MTKKGISPLIASVILIAFVIAVAAIAGNFFTGFTEKQKVTVETKGGTLIDCSVTRMEIDPSSISSSSDGDTISFAVTNMGEEDITNLKVDVYNGINIETLTPTLGSGSTTLSKGATEKFTVDPTMNTTFSVDHLYNIKVKTSDCPGIDSEANCSNSDCTSWKMLG